MSKELQLFLNLFFSLFLLSSLSLSKEIQETRNTTKIEEKLKIKKDQNKTKIEQDLKEPKIYDLSELKNISLIKKNLKLIEKIYSIHSVNSSEDDYLCDKMDEKIHNFTKLKKNLVKFLKKIDKGGMTFNNLSEMLEVRGDTEFNIHNLNKIINIINKSKPSCFQSIEEYKKEKKKQKNDKKGKLFSSINHLINEINNKDL